MFAKAIERYNRFMTFIDNTDVLSEKQFGFRPSHSTFITIIELAGR